MSNFNKALEILREAKQLFAVKDGWDEGNSVTMVFSTEKQAKDWIEKANGRSPGRWNVGSVASKDGYELSTDDDIKRYTTKYISKKDNK